MRITQIEPIPVRVPLKAGLTTKTVHSETYPADIIGTLYHEADLLRTPLLLGPEVARVPEGPGLGVELDEEQLSYWKDKCI